MRIGKDKSIIFILIDIAIICISFFLAFLIRFDFVVTLENSIYFLTILYCLPILVFTHIVVFAIAGVLRNLWKYVSVEETVRITISAFLSNCINYAFINLTGFRVVPRSVYIISTILIVFGTVGSRTIYRLWGNRKKIKVMTNAIIIGAGDAGYLLAKEILANPKYNDRIIGFIDDNPLKKGRSVNGVKILGSCDDLVMIVNKFAICNVYVAIPSASNKEIKRILDICQNLNLKVLIMGISEIGNSAKPVLRDISIEDLLGRGEIKLSTNDIEEYIKGKTVLITGAGGSIGSELCRQVLKFNPKEIICFDIYENGMYDLEQELLIKQKSCVFENATNLICLIGSVRDTQRLDEIMNLYEPNIVFHAAAHKHVPLVEDSPKEAIKNNVLGTLNVVNACIEHKVSSMILISTDKAVNPTNVMGATKRLCELIIQAFRQNGVTKLSAVRFGNVLGSNGSVIPLFKKQIEAGGPLTVTDKNITRYFMTIPEATQLVLQAATYSKDGDIFVLDMGSPVRILDLAEDLIRLSGLKPYDDIEIEFVGLRPGEKMYEELSLGNERRHKTDNDLIFINESMDISKEEILEKITALRGVLEAKLENVELKSKIIEIINTDNK